MKKGIACSKGSACQSGSDAGSHVLNNILTEEQNKFVSLRFSFSIYNTKKEIKKSFRESTYCIALKKLRNFYTPEGFPKK